MNRNDADNGWEHGFDWQNVRQRVAVASVAMAEPGETSPEVVQQTVHTIWARRAAQLAQVPTQEDEGEQIELVLVCRVCLNHQEQL